MKKAFILVLFLLLTACQPTPEVDAVRQKNQGEMIEMAKATPEVSDIAREPVQVRVEAQGPDYRAMYDIPEHLSRELAGADGRLVIHIDADVKVPENAMPIVRVHPVDFSQELVYQMWDRLIGDAEMYIDSDERTKEIIEKQMEYYLSIANGEYDNGMETPEEAREELKRLQEEYRTAPEGKPPERADGTLQKMEVTNHDYNANTSPRSREPIGLASRDWRPTIQRPIKASGSGTTATTTSSFRGRGRGCP